jgi:hypothetical protein
MLHEKQMLPQNCSRVSTGKGPSAAYGRTYDEYPDRVAAPVPDRANHTPARTIFLRGMLEAGSQKLTAGNRESRGDVGFIRLGQ